MTYGNATQYVLLCAAPALLTARYQFMCGEWILVAPVYENATTRNNIYLPKGAHVSVGIAGATGCPYQ